METLTLFYGTFGQNQYLGLLKDYYVEIYAYNKEAAQDLMREAFSHRYSMVRENLDLSIFDRRLGIITQQS